MAAAALVAAGAWTWPSFAQSAPEDPFEPVAGVEYDAATGRLKVSVAGESFRRVMDTVADGAGLDIAVDDAAEGELTAEFDYLPLEDGLTELLADRNYVFTRSEDGSRLASVRVLSHAGATPEPAPMPPAPSQPESTPPSQARAEPEPPAPRPVLPPQVARMFVTEEMMDEIMGVLTHHQETDGLDVRAKLLEMRGQVDPDFDPQFDGRELSDRELLKSVLELAVQGGRPGEPPGGAGMSR